MLHGVPAPLESRFALEKAVAAYTAKHPVGAVPRPPYWIGYRVAPMVIEFWREQVITRQPAAENRFTVACPIPRLAPVRSSVLRRVLEVMGAHG